MRHSFVAIVAAALMLPRWAGAVELKDTTAKSDDKRINISAVFSMPVPDQDFEVVSNYAGNFVALSVKGLTFSKQQLKREVPPPDESLKQFYKYIRCVEADGAGQVRIYLAKLVSPADVLIELRGDRAEVEIVKPWWKLQGAKPPAAAGTGATGAGANPAQPGAKPPGGAGASGGTGDEGAAWPANAGSLRPGALEEPSAEQGGARETPPAGAAAQPPEGVGAAEPAPGATEPPSGAQAAPAAGPPAAPGPGAGSEAAPGGATEPVLPAGGAEHPAQGGVVYDETRPSDLLGPEGGSTTGSGGKPRPRDDETTPAGGSTAAPPAASGASAAPGGMPRHGPAYTQFDLDQVPISGIEIRGLPFSQALMKLVASSGFNVVVGKDIEDTIVNLNFTQKQISLKGALDLLCIAYDLAYTVEPDAIVIKAKGGA
jgi:hypothetical protein